MSEILKQTMKFLMRGTTKPAARDEAATKNPVATANLELVSTGALQELLESNDEEAKRSIRKAAEGRDGVLAHDAENNRYEIVDVDGNEDFSLVSTKMLYRMLVKDNPIENDVVGSSFSGSGDPYDND